MPSSAVAILIAGRADVRGREHDAGHAVVDQGAGDAVDLVGGIAGGQQGAAARSGGVAEFERNRRGGARDAVDPRVAVIVDHAAGRLDGGDRDLAGIVHEDADPGLAVLRGDQPALDRERADAGEDVAAILGVGDDRLVDEHLEEEIVDVDAPRDPTCDTIATFEVSGSAPPMPSIWRGSGEPITRSRKASRSAIDGGKVVLEEIAALGRAAAHPHAAHADAVRHI